MAETFETEPLDDPRSITRPDRALLRYYLLQSLFALVFFPFVFIPLWFKYSTLRYRFDEDGVTMSYGRFFERETYLTYRRIQDIQMTRGLLQRFFGLADLELQTASGGAGSEMKIEGVRNPDRLRDFLYEHMRGAEAEAEEEASGRARPHRADSAPAAEGDEALVLLREIRDALRASNRAGAER